MGDRATRGRTDEAERTLLIGIAVVAVAALAGQAGATSRSAIKLSGTYAVHGESGKTDCNPISQANPAVLTCTVSGFTLDYTGSLTGQGVNDFRWIVDCSTGKSYTARSDAWRSRSGMSARRSLWCRAADVRRIVIREREWATSTSGLLATQRDP